MRQYAFCLLLMFAQPVVAEAPGMPSAGASLAPPTGTVVLEVEGDIANGNGGTGIARFDEAMLAALPSHTLKTSTVVTDGTQVFEGFLMRDLLALLGARGSVVAATALNDYSVEIPVSDFSRFDVIVATTRNGKRLEKSGKGPLWIVYPRDDHEELQDIRYDYRWVWQLYRLDIK